MSPDPRLAHVFQLVPNVFVSVLWVNGNIP